jgi:hypothetical protein
VSISEVDTRIQQVCVAPMSGHRYALPACLKSASNGLGR